MSITPLTLSGGSQYASDFQNVLNRAVQIAQIPVTRLQNRDSDLLQQKSSLAGISSAAASLAADLKSLGTIAASKALTATSSNSAVIQATASGASAPTTYTINSVTSLSAPAAETSLSGVADATSTAVSSTGIVDLVVGSTHHSITLTNNTMISLRDQINGLGAGVSASILTTSGGNYLSLTANAPGATTLKLLDDPTGANTNLISNTNQGTDAVFSLNGIRISQKDNTVNSVIPGVTFSLLKPSATPVTISLTSDGSPLSSALSQFASDYNGLQSQLHAQVGSAAGLLSGNGTVVALQQVLRQVASNYSPSGTVHSLADLGVTFDASGKASFTQSTFNSLSTTQINDAFKFIGDAGSGLTGANGNGLAGLARGLTQFSDPVSGLIQLQEDAIDVADRRIQAQITAATDRINAMQTNLSQRLAKADALQSHLQSQQQGLTASLQSLSLVLYGKNAQSV